MYIRSYLPLRSSFIIPLTTLKGPSNTFSHLQISHLRPLTLSTYLPSLLLQQTHKITSHHNHNILITSTIPHHIATMHDHHNLMPHTTQPTSLPPQPTSTPPQHSQHTTTTQSAHHHNPTAHHHNTVSTPPQHSQQSDTTKQQEQQLIANCQFS